MSTTAQHSPARTLFAFAPYLLVSAVYLVVTALGQSATAVAIKPALMPALLLALLLCWPWRATRWLVLVLAVLEVVFAWIGDVVLADPGSSGFLLGLGAFFLAHLAGLALYLGPLRRGRIPWIAALLLLWWGALLVVLLPHLGALLIPVALYGLVLGGAAAAAWGVNRWVGLGALSFLASDTVLALRMFLPDFALWQHSLILMMLYLLGQGLIVYGVLREVRGTLSAAAP